MLLKLPRALGIFFSEQLFFVSYSFQMTEHVIELQKREKKGTLNEHFLNEHLKNC